VIKSRVEVVWFPEGTLMEIKLKWTWRPIIKSKNRLRLKWRTPMEVKAHLKGLLGACSKL